jgi:hypothetical protein
MDVQLVKIFFDFMELEGSFIFSQEADIVLYTIPINLVHILTSCFRNIYFSLIRSSCFPNTVKPLKLDTPISWTPLYIGHF